MARVSVPLTSSHQKAVHFPPISGVPVNLSPHSRQRESMCASHGLLNAPGDNNCFLNSAVQIFWHLDVFRRSFRRLNDHVCLDNACIFCGIKMLFRQFQESVDSTLAPDMLRRALASTFEDQQRFQLGCMDDAAECFENILLRIHYHVQGTSEVANCTDPLCIPHRKFAMDLSETFACNDCQYSSEPSVFSQMVHYVPVEGLLQKTAEMKQRGVKSVTGLFGKLIRKANESGDQQRICRRCSSRNACLKRTLTNRPDIITIGLAWSSAEKPKTQTISDVLHSVDTNICLCHLYHSARETEWASSAVHHLVGMICFYGRHYVSFFYHSRYQQWMYFDDASVKVIGSDFSQVLTKCIKGHMQPLLLFYANPEFETVGDDLRYLAASDTSSCLSGKGSIELEERRAPARPAPPRPPLRTVSRTTLPYQQQHQTVPFKSQDQFTASSITKPAGGVSNLQMPGGHCSRQNSRASVTSSSIASVDSFEISLDHFRSPYAYPPRYRNSIESSTRDETDSGCPSGESHTSTSSTSSSSVEVPAVKRDTFKPIPTAPQSATATFTPLPTRNHYIQMVLRADDLISSGSLKEEKTDYTGAIKLFEQAAGLLQSCTEPLKGCPQLSQAVSAKQMDCYKRLHVLHDKITAHRSASTTSGHSRTSDGRSSQPADALKTLPRHRAGAGLAKKAVPIKLMSKYPATDELSRAISRTAVKPETSTKVALAPIETDDSLKRAHKSRRRAAAKTSLGSRESNRSMPDLSLNGQEKNSLSHSTTLATFKAPTNYATMCVRSAARETLLNELSQKFQMRATTRAQEEDDDDESEEDEEFPPPPPEFLLPEVSDAEQSDNGTAVVARHPCTLCGQRLVAQDPYCPDCQTYLSRFSKRL